MLWDFTLADYRIICTHWYSSTFSLKESLYKAMHPLICQYVGFQEAEVTPHADGTATVVWNLKSGAHEQFGTVTAHWRRFLDGEYFLTSAKVTKRE
jgi:4'-phosphopantetheinyl transferase EntD